MRNNSLNDVQRALLHELMFREGIIPMETHAMDVSRVLAQLSPDEARKAKRKFRKLVRKLRNKTDSFIETLENGKPTRHQKRLRKLDVWRSFMVTVDKIIYDLLEEGQKS